jgi:hypothetical protein
MKALPSPRRLAESGPARPDQAARARRGEGPSGVLWGWALGRAAGEPAHCHL